MSERESKLQSNFFSFVCPAGREKEAQELLKGIGRTSLSPDLMPTIRNVFDPDIGGFVTIQGVEIHGISFTEDITYIVRALSKADIAGYSRATQVVSHRGEIIK